MFEKNMLSASVTVRRTAWRSTKPGWQSSRYSPLILLPPGRIGSHAVPSDVEVAREFGALLDEMKPALGAGPHQRFDSLPGGRGVLGQHDAQQRALGRIHG